jgi:CRP/FNR family transcriptional regulator, anaerobic regulatory protein
MKEILNYLSQTYWKLTEEVMTYVLQKCDERVIPKGEILLEEGKVCRHVWFIKKGMLRAYQYNPEDDRVYSHWFMKKGDIATSVISFFRELPSEENIVTMEDTVVFQMSHKDLFAGMERFPSLGMLTTLIIAKYYCDCKFNEDHLRMGVPQFIHQRMLAENHEILQRALKDELASFLGVTEPTYRKIKSGKYKQKQDKDKPAKPAKSKKI